MHFSSVFDFEREDATEIVRIRLKNASNFDAQPKMKTREIF